jgi:hypothetical protein
VSYTPSLHHIIKITIATLDQSIGEEIDGRSTNTRPLTKKKKETKTHKPHGDANMGSHQRYDNVGLEFWIRNHRSRCNRKIHKSKMLTSKYQISQSPHRRGGWRIKMQSDPSWPPHRQTLTSQSKEANMHLC